VSVEAGCAIHTRFEYLWVTQQLRAIVFGAEQKVCEDKQQAGARPTHRSEDHPLSTKQAAYQPHRKTNSQLLPSSIH
jgi:hypothetical protein